MVAHGIPRRLVDATWGEVHVPEALEWKAEVALPARLDRGQGLVIFGPVGTGKSSLAALIAGEAIKLGRSVRWEQADSLLEELLQRGNDQSKAIAARVRCRQAALLILDDLGVSTLQPWQIAPLDLMINYRYSHRRSTIVTTNMDPALLANDQAWERIRDRWRQTNQRLDMAGKSRRVPEEQ